MKRKCLRNMVSAQQLISCICSFTEKLLDDIENQPGPSEMYAILPTLQDGQRRIKLKLKKNFIPKKMMLRIYERRSMSSEKNKSECGRY